jgi:conjugative transfer signal peptidase TraF
VIAPRQSARLRGVGVLSSASSGYLAAVLVGTAIVALPAVQSPRPVLLFNPSPSAPRGWYLLGPELPRRIGQYALAHLPSDAARLASERHYLPLGIPLLKSVGALRGDYVCADSMQVRINRRVVGRPLSQDARHRPLDAWRGCLVLSAGQYFLLSVANPASFDSRYFGPVSRELIIGRAVPLWTWQ